jgi:hypothetical protein
MKCHESVYMRLERARPLKTCPIASVYAGLKRRLLCTVSVRSQPLVGGSHASARLNCIRNMTLRIVRVKEKTCFPSSMLRCNHATADSLLSHCDSSDMSIRTPLHSPSISLSELPTFPTNHLQSLPALLRPSPEPFRHARQATVGLRLCVCIRRKSRPRRLSWTKRDVALDLV